MAHELVDAIARLGQVDWRAAGLEGVNVEAKNHGTAAPAANAAGGARR